MDDVGTPSNVATPHAATPPEATRPRSRAWVKQYMPDAVNRVLRDYDAGMNAAEIQAAHGVSKATLYRWIAQYQDQPNVDNDPACMRLRIATLEKTNLYLADRLAALESSHAH